MKLKHLQLILSILGLISIFPTLCAQPEIKVFEKRLSEIQSKSKIPGFAFAIVKNDSIIYSKGFGYANIKQKQLYNTKTIQPIASISKTFIALALMKAIDQGHFTLETNINDILPFKIINPFHPNDTIKIKHLVTHTSGLIDNDSIFSWSYSTSQKPKMDFKTFFYEYYSSTGKLYSKLNFSNSKPGEQYNYSNISAALVAYLIELKTNISFPEYTSKYIYQPLKMVDTHWFYDSSKANKYATLYEITKQTGPEYKLILNPDHSVKPYTDITYPDGKLYSSVDDMAKYLIAMIKGYSSNAGILSTSSFKTLFEKQFNEANKPTDTNPEEPNRAVFWAYDEKGRITHTGSDYGLTTFLVFDPLTKIGHIIFFNAAFDGDNNEKAIEDVVAIFNELKIFKSKIQ